MPAFFSLESEVLQYEYDVSCSFQFHYYAAGRALLRPLDGSRTRNLWILTGPTAFALALPIELQATLLVRQAMHVCFPRCRSIILLPIQNDQDLNPGLLLDYRGVQFPTSDLSFLT